ncbi:MAG: helix-turn-helix domain-containing protein [Prevotella sp.]|nr:helix-turn-helix domain-containing protein [Prevotella sp.]MCM1075157.1 helix-turn-helix domain-containing protein [Ruminococcus sp.]
MLIRKETADILAFLDSFVSSKHDVAMLIAGDFRKRRIEKGITREMMAEKSGVPISNIARFEQKGLISLKNLIELACALGFRADISNIFSEPKYSTMAELTQIRDNMGKKKAYPKRKKNEED